MIDIHCHILPGMDNGPQTMKETLAMAKKAEKQGIHTIIATPHYHDGIFYNEKDAIVGAADYVNAKLHEQQVKVTILPGQVIRIYADLVRDLERGKLLPLNESTGYVLLELPPDFTPAFVSKLVFDIQIAGYKPILANPEENKGLRDNSHLLYELVKNGALAQTSARSVMGAAGRRTEKWVLQLLDANLAHFVASNAYNGKMRGIRLRQAYKTVGRQLGTSTVELLKENSALLAHGEPIIRDAPQRLSNRKHFFS
ncbi:tyrosine protein phosphatase [Virgibacillus dakarensis]|nr:tyrosine protein phosphatase [Virgibacillus dakarensis]